MKIIFANNFNYLRGGSERVMSDEMALLKAHDVSLLIYSRLHPDNDYCEFQKFFPPHLEYEGEGICNKLRTARELIYSQATASGLRALIKEHKPDLLHGHNIYGRLTTSVFDVAQEMGISSVITLHDYKLICPSYLLLREGQVCELCVAGSSYQCLVKRCHKGSIAASAVYVAEAYFTRIFKKYNKVRYFICPSQFLLEKHKQGGLPAEKLVYVPNAINVDGFLPEFEGGKYALFVGRLSREKGVRTLLKAVKGLNVPVRLVGDGPLRAEFESFAVEQGITTATFEGYRGGKELQSLFQNAAFLVFPSEWYENAPMTILEAYGYGKPVIGANIGGIPEMIVEGETGLLFPPGDADALREKINLLWSQPSLVKEMGKNARQRVEEKYNSEIHLKKLLEVYQAALA